MTMPSYSVDIARMEALTAGELYCIMKLRVDVFVVEQSCPYHELDGCDDVALHLRLMQGNTLLAYARIFASTPQSRKARIGRVIVSPEHRGNRLGNALMHEAVTACERLSPGAPIALSAQSHLKEFYADFGFVVHSLEYIEDGIPHIDMIRHTRIDETPETIQP